MHNHSLELIRFMAKKGISFKSTDNEGDNVMFYNNNIECKMSYRLFYRYSGPAVIYSSSYSNRGVETMEVIKLTPEKFYNLYMKSILVKYFNLN